MSKMKKMQVLYYSTLKKIQSENSSYFYSIQLDKDDMITNIFCVDAHSIGDYSIFRDVVYFDTTYMTNEFGHLHNLLWLIIIRKHHCLVQF